jgi:hypothetical protein
MRSKSPETQNSLFELRTLVTAPTATTEYAGPEQDYDDEDDHRHRNPGISTHGEYFTLARP